MMSVQQIIDNIRTGSISPAELRTLTCDDWQTLVESDWLVQKACADRRSAARAAACYPGGPLSEEYEEFRSDHGGSCLFTAWEDPVLFTDAYSYWVANPRWINEPRTAAFVAAVRQEDMGWLETLAAAATLTEINWDEVDAAAASVQNERVKQWVRKAADRAEGALEAIRLIM